MVEEQKPVLSATLENVDKPVVVSDEKPAAEASAQIEKPVEEVKVEVSESQEAAKPSVEPMETSEAKEDCPIAFEDVKNEEKAPEGENKEAAEGEKTEEAKAENGEAAVPAEPATPAPENPPESMRNVKIARIPKEVVEFMLKDEAEDGTVRINVSQMRFFLCEELWKLAKYVNGTVWDKCEFPVLDMLVPENAKKYLNVQTFNTVKIKEEEKRITAEIEKVSKLEGNQYAKMNDVHKKKVWADMDKKYTVKDNMITREGMPPQTPQSEKKKNNKPPSVPSQIQPAVPAGPGAPKAGAAAKATPAAQNGANGNKSDNAARKRPNQAGGTGGESSPAKKSKGPDNRKNQGQKGGFPRKSGGGPPNKFNNQRQSAPSRFNNPPSRFETAQPWSNPSSAPFNTQFSSFRSAVPAPAPMSYGGYDSLAERERSLMERERRLLAAESQLPPTPSYGSTGGYGTGTSDYRTTYDNYANSSFGASSASASAYATPGYGVTSSSYKPSSFETGGYGSSGTTFSTTNNTYGSFLPQMQMTHSSPVDNRGRGGNNGGNRRSGGGGGRRF